ncbi:MAG: excinuclease ABC subunit UvrC [Gammaproteobacteria bacterium]
MNAPATVADFDLEEFLRSLTHRPGVYRMLDGDGKALYIGKAKDLKKRVSSYFRRGAHNTRIQTMLTHVLSVDVAVTNSEAEALLLENNLIKEQRPRYNVNLRDDKSYPYIYLATEHAYPRLGFYRGARRGKGQYFGPYASAGATRETLNQLQKLFRVRQCKDSFFRNRSRPCLQHQIKRCTAPCVGLTTPDEYQVNVKHAIQFLEGKSSEVIEELIERMEAAAGRLEFELAGEYRDQIEAVRRVSERQYVSGAAGDVDIVAVKLWMATACVQVFSIRAGRNLGNRSFFPQIPAGIDEAGLLTAFLGQYYLAREAPAEIIVNVAPADEATLAQMLSLKRGQAVSISHNVRGERARWVDLATRNVDHGLKARLASKAGMLERLEALQDELGLEAMPARMECFDISHTMGEAAVASCVVFGPEGAIKSDYRRFNIANITPGDDYAAMKQALTRRYTRLKKGEGKLPDILFIDGGKGQVRQAVETLEELQIEGVTIVGVAKGEGRRPGLEQLILSDQSAPTILPSTSAALHLIQQIRDEAHRFAITGHRQRRAKARRQSPLEQISGLGPKRRQILLKHFGGLRGVSRAAVEELSKVPGISRRLAEQVFDAFHDDG